VNISDTIDGARRAFELAGRGCLVRIGRTSRATRAWLR